MSELYLVLTEMFCAYPEFEISYSLTNITILVDEKLCLAVLLDPDEEFIFFDYDAKTPVGDACVFQTISYLKGYPQNN